MMNSDCQIKREENNLTNKIDGQSKDENSNMNKRDSNNDELKNMSKRHSKKKSTIKKSKEKIDKLMKDLEEKGLRQQSNNDSDNSNNEIEESEENSDSGSEDSSSHSDEIPEDEQQLNDKHQSPLLKEEPKKKKTFAEIANFVLNDWRYIIFMSIVTVYVLFADDIKMLTTPKSADDTFSALTVLFMTLFLIEFFISCFVVENYFCGFFFYLDLISCLSMLMDITWVYNLLIESLGSSGSKIKSAASIAKASRGARVGSRAVKILRILRIIRLVRIAKLYKASSKLAEKEENIINKNGTHTSTKSKEIVPEESKVGKKLTDLTTRRVIILVLSMIIGVILFNSNFYYSALTSMDFGMKIFNEFNDFTDPSFNLTFDIYVTEHYNISSPILYAEVYNLTYGQDISNDLRFDEKIEVNEECANFVALNESARCYALFDNRSSSKINSVLNIAKTLFICFALAWGSICFSQDTTDMVLVPIESMIDKIEKISKNPIEAMEENEKEDFLNNLANQKEQGCCAKEKNNTTVLETFILEKTITKIGALLALGFGEAGSKIIISNMTNIDDTEINPMIRGKKVMAIYGFCDIRNFTDTTEVLEEQVMIFVNEIAEIVHEITNDYGGYANKNIGDAFLLVWKFENEWIEYNDRGELVGLKKCKQVSELVDCSVIAFLKILSKVHKSYKLDKYRKNPGLNRRIKNYAVKMGFGLHLGWSIEGAIGSTFKIDASYLSPHVNISGKLEEKTKEYGAQMIISGDLVEYMTDNAKANLRIIDRVSFIEGQEMNIYTVDIDLLSLKIEDSPELEKTQMKMEKRLARKTLNNRIIEGVSNEWDDYEEKDEDWVIMRNKFTQEFFDMYNEGYIAYVNGDWKAAKEHLEEAQRLIGETDRPSTRILNLISKHNYEKPDDWVYIRD